MPRKNARPAAKKRRDKIKADMKMTPQERALLKRKRVIQRRLSAQKAERDFMINAAAMVSIIGAVVGRMDRTRPSPPTGEGG